MTTQYESRSLRVVMKAGDTIRVTKGEYKGQQGGLVSEWIAFGEGGLNARHFRTLWFVKFQNGKHDLIRSSMLEIVEPIQSFNKAL